jgi:hypothetical protein
MMDAISKFWWGDDDNSNKMHWFAWWKLCLPKNDGGMGFRDFHSFNLAMLAKQVWRLIADPNSLCAKVLRAKYYPDGDILKAGPKSGSSFTWQSIVASIPTFKRGYIWRVGNGDKINIWSDPWVPTSHDRRVTSARGNAIVTKVSDLIDPYTGQWDEPLLRDIFNAIDAEPILQIPLNTHGFEDFIAWGFSQNGVYTVRSAYHLQWRHQFGPTTGQAVHGSSSANPIWRSIWKLKIPSKIKIFIWRVLHGILPLKSTLVNRHIGTSGECPICQLGLEDIQHLLFLCPVASDIWQALGVSNLIQSALVTDRSGSAVFQALLSCNGQNYQNFDMGMRETIAVACWYLWWI